MAQPLPIIQGRGTALNPGNRFVRFSVEDDFEHAEPGEEPAKITTEYFVDSSMSIIARNESPDVGFSSSINPYRGCSHGCIYCYARPTHEYLGFSAGLDFETKIMVKRNAPDLLRKELSAPKWQAQVLAMSGVTDCYQPVERKLQLTRRCLEVLLEFRNPVTLITKNHLITRDIDLLSQLATHRLTGTFVSVTSLDADLTRLMEPRTSAPRRRLEAISELAAAGIPVGVMVAPIIPGLTDHEVPGILRAAADAGACWAGYTIVRLPFAVKDLFADWLSQHFPDRKEKILNRIRSLRNGKLNDSDFRTRMSGEGIWAGQIKTMFDLARRKVGLDKPFPALSMDQFRRPAEAQMTLW